MVRTTVCQFSQFSQLGQLVWLAQLNKLTKLTQLSFLLLLLAGSAHAAGCNVNGDASTNVADVQLCVNQAISVIACSSGDIDGNGACNVVDVQRVVNAALGGTCVAAGGGGTGGLPTGVTLRDIDGGPNYYCSHGFTYACNAGWDNPAFFPIGLFLAPMLTSFDATRWLDLNLNAFWLITGNSSLSLLRNNNFHGVVQAGELTQILGGNGGTLGTETIGLETADEPETEALATGAIGSVACNLQNNRLWEVNFTWNWLAFGDNGGVPSATLMSKLYNTPCGTQRHLDFQTIDIYWFAGGAGGVGAYDGGKVYGLSRSLTTDENNRACHYGDNVDMLRVYQAGAGHFPAPLAVYVENGGPYVEDTTASTYIQPAELNAGVWSTIIHGARYIKYFNHSFAGPAVSNDNLSETYYQTIQPGQSVSIYNQTKQTNANVKALATVINSPFADGFASVSPAASNFAGFDLMAKYHNVTGGDQKFYLFAMPRWSKTLSNQTATFTIKNTGSTQVTVLNENRTIPITNNGTQFVDSFATANTVHIYRVQPPAWPDATNTGVPSGTSLTVVNGNLDITTAGTVVENKDVRGCIHVTAPDVIIRKSKVSCADFYVIDNESTNLLIEDVTVDCQNLHHTGIVWSNYTARRVNVSACENGLWAENNVVIEDSYVHDIIPYDPVTDPHTDGIQIPSNSTNITIRHNRIYGQYSSANSFGNSAIFIGTGPSNSMTSNITVTNNLLAGGGYTLYCNQGGRGTNSAYTDNRFSTIFSPKVGGIGPWTDCADENISGNVYHETGLPVTPG
jgi:hypothetical protein